MGLNCPPAQEGALAISLKTIRLLSPNMRTRSTASLANSDVNAGPPPGINPQLLTAPRQMTASPGTEHNALMLSSRDERSFAQVVNGMPRSPSPCVSPEMLSHTRSAQHCAV